MEPILKYFRTPVQMFQLNRIPFRGRSNSLLNVKFYSEARRFGSLVRALQPYFWGLNYKSNFYKDGANLTNLTLNMKYSISSFAMDDIVWRSPNYVTLYKT